mgnify:CR=1 FL=1
MSGRIFKLTVADYLDILVFFMVAFVWEAVSFYSNSEIKEALFGPEVDS